MKVRLRDGKCESNYVVSTLEKYKIFFTFNDKPVRDCYPLYPVHFFTDDFDRINLIESLDIPEHWIARSLNVPDSQGCKDLLINELGEYRKGDMDFQDDEVDIFHDKEKQTALIKIGEQRGLEYYSIAQDVIAGVNDNNLVELFFLNFSNHKT